MKNIAVIVAGGSSMRCGFDKLFTEDFGDLVLHRAITSFQNSNIIDEVVIVLSAKNFGQAGALQSKFSKVSKILPGGDTRYESVKNAIEYLNVKELGNARVIIHNGANPDLTLPDLESGIELAESKKNVIFGYFTPNSMKKVVNGRVVSFLNRDEIFETQTPQISNLKTFVKAIKSVEACREVNPGGQRNLPRDEAELLSLVGEDVFIYECDPSNKKVTYASDLSNIEKWRVGSGGTESIFLKMDNSEQRMVNSDFRIGIGEDSHRFMDKFDPNKPLVIGGVSFPESKKTFDSNSDGDVILHSLCNAILSSVGEKTFDKFATPMCKSGITDSGKYLEKSMEIVCKKYPKFEIINVVFSLEGRYPRLAPRHDDMIGYLKKILNISCKKIGITYTTGEELSSYGEGVGIYCLCNIFVRLK